MNPRKIALEILNRSRTEDTIIDYLIDEILNKNDLTPRDRALVFEIVQGTIRWHNKLAWIGEQFLVGNFSRAPLPIQNILEMTFYQILFLSKTPDYAAVNEAVNLARKFKGQFWAKRVNAVLRNFLRKKDQLKYPELAADPVKAISINYSHPEWLVKRWLHQFGEEATCKLCGINNQKPHHSLRVNRLKTNAAEFQTELEKAGVKVTPSKMLPDFFRAEHLPSLNEFSLFRKGFFSIQDESAGLPAQLLAPKPGDKVLDLCAAPGGKTTHLAEISEDKADIIAVENVFLRLQLIRENVERLGLKNISLVQGDARTFATAPVDKILLDAPCSGLGVLAKRADLRWKRTLEDIRELKSLQYEMLCHAAELLTEGGALVYSTCTIEPEENEQIIRLFLATHADFELDNPARFIPAEFIKDEYFVQTLPHIHGTDGSFAARLVKGK